jgi:hypothetical protein
MCPYLILYLSQILYDDIEMELGLHDTLEETQKAGTTIYIQLFLHLIFFHLDVPSHANMACT